MDNKNRVVYENKKTGRKFSFVNSFSKKDFSLVLIIIELVKLFTNQTFLEFVVKIVELIMNGSFYYFCNNRIFVFYEVKYGFGWIDRTKNKRF